MHYHPEDIENKWRDSWKKNDLYKVDTLSSKPKYYVLDMFPYPSGSGLHVGHPLGYIASDIFSRYKRLSGYNVLHPMGFDAFGLPAEQYAIQSGVHPADSTSQNVARYRSQLDNIGLCFDWSRQVNTSDPDYYKWTQWIFLKLYNHYFDNDTDQATAISSLIATFHVNGNQSINAATTQDAIFTADEWNAMNAKAQEEVLMNYRLAYRKTGHVNWCEALGTVLANDEVKDGVSERGGHPVEKKAMIQWSLRITAFAERLLNDLENLTWSDALKAMQKNWIGRSQGAQLFFDIEGNDAKLEIFTTRPDTIFGATYMVLAPEHDLVAHITTDPHKDAVAQYLAYVGSRSDVERMAEVKEVTGVFTGAYAIHPYTDRQVPIWLGEYVLKDYGTGAIMAVPSDDMRDLAFAKKYNLEIIDVVDKSQYPGASLNDKLGVMINSDFVNGMQVPDAIEAVLKSIEAKKIGVRKINYKLRDANYSRQRYWGEPFPIKYDADGLTHTMSVDELPLTLPSLENFQPAAGGKSPLARATEWVQQFDGYQVETDTMPGFAGSSWYFLRYMDPNNPTEFASRAALDYWQDVDLYVGGTEHAVGHLMYARFWHKFLYDLGLVPTNEPFKKLINQGMITAYGYYAEFLKFGSSEDEISLIGNSKDLPTRTTLADGKAFYNVGGSYRLPYIYDYLDGQGRITKEKFIQYLKEIGKEYNVFDNLEKYHWSTAEDGENGTIEYFTVNIVQEKMSKSKYNVQNPDEVVAKYGADCFRMYEMFLGPIEQSKPWDTKGIDGVQKFLRKFWHLYADETGLIVNDEKSTPEELKILHTAIKKITEDIERFSFNTCVSAFMVCVNELKKLECHKREILQPLCVLIAPFAPFIAEELWQMLGNNTSVHITEYPIKNDSFLTSDTIEYPICINGKKRDAITFDANLSPKELETQALALDIVQKWLEGKTIIKIIVVPNRMINFVVKD